jgi:hypothetical protein
MSFARYRERRRALMAKAPDVESPAARTDARIASGSRGTHAANLTRVVPYSADQRKGEIFEGKLTDGTVAMFLGETQSPACLCTRVA